MAQFRGCRNEAIIVLCSTSNTSNVRMFCNHLLSRVGPSFAKHSSSSLVCLLSATLLYNHSEVIPPLPHLRWNRRHGEEVPIKEGKRWDSGWWGGERERRVVLEGNWEHLCLASLHSITIIHALKLAWRTVRVSLGVSTLHSVPLAISTQHITIDHV